MQTLTREGFDVLFHEARTRNGWQDKPVPEALLREIFNVMRMGPTSANCQPLRVTFVTSEEGKQRLKPALMGGNVDKTMQAPVTAIFAHDLEFHERLPDLFPHADARSWFAGKPKAIQENAFRNGSLQAAYFMIAARGLGLSCGPMSGFDKDKVKEAFFPERNWEVNFLCNLGYGNEDDLFERLPRPEFEDMCEVV